MDVVTKINLKAFAIPPKQFDYRTGDILKKVRQNQDLATIKQSFGLISYGVLEAIQEEGGFGWAISDYIEFSYNYTGRPNFSFGLDGMAGIDWSAGDNTYSKELPSSLSVLTTETYQPAIFIPRIIHWHIDDFTYKGCYILVSQVNPNTTETDKTIRIHYRFEGSGYKKG